jgi:glycosyltransferase involved in cell wall biosynthesis
MGKKSTGTGPKKYYPLVSVCTPTFNRRPFIPVMIECFRAQTYPKDRMEWVIVDDGTDKIKDVLDAEATDLLPLIKYVAVDTKMSLGAKRNLMHTKTKGSIIVYMDDDDYYPPERVEHAVTTLMANKEALCAGSSEMYILFKLDNPQNPTLVSAKKTIKMYQCGPYGPNHATAGTFAFKSRLLDDTKYEDHAALAEEKAFLKNYTVPFVQLDPLKTILVFSHNHNTFDKKKMLEHADPNVIRESPKTVDDFLKTHPQKDKIKKFFMEDIETLLRNYAPGDPKMKPDVLEQTKKIEESRRQMMQQQFQQQQQPFLQMEHPGKPPVQMTMQQTVEFINQQHKEILALRQRVQELEALGSNHMQHSSKPSTSQKPRREMQGPVEGSKKPNTHNDVSIIHNKLKSEPEIYIQI